MTSNDTFSVYQGNVKFPLTGPFYKTAKLEEIFFYFYNIKRYI